MIKLRPVLTLAIAAVALTACTKGQIAATAELDQPDPDNEGQMVTRALADMEVRLYPFDRDLVFDSLDAAASTPEPPVPDSLATAIERVQQLQEEWQTSRTEWQTIRDRLQEINRQLEGMGRTDPRYRALYNEFSDVEPRMNAAERNMEASFAAFDELQKEHHRADRTGSDHARGLGRPGVCRARNDLRRKARGQWRRDHVRHHRRTGHRNFADLSPAPIGYRLDTSCRSMSCTGTFRSRSTRVIRYRFS